MELQAAQRPISMAPKHPSAPPPPIRRKLQVPTEPLVFVAVVVALVTFIAKAVPTETSAASAATMAQGTAR